MNRSGPSPHHPGDPGLIGEPLIDAEPDAAPPPPAASRWFLGLSLVLIALNLRPVFSSLSALLPEVMRGTGASPAAASVITTLPILCLGLFSPLAPRWAARAGSERVIFYALVPVAVGTAVRGFGTVAALLIGATLAGGGIAIVNVLLPGLVKRDFPDRIAPMTGIYSMALSGGAALAAAFTVPVERGLGGSWAGALAAWALPAAAVAALWAPRALAAAPMARPTATAAARATRLWRDALAWQVSLFMGLQSALAYCTFGWLAPILRDHGFEAAAAGYAVSVSVVGQMVGCLVAPSLAVIGRDQRLACTALYALTLGGLLGCFYAPHGAVWFCAVALGLGQGGLVAVALTLILLRAPDAADAARLSGMAQGIGYTLAAAGPLLVGLLRQAFGGFETVPVLFVALALAGTLAGLGAGRDRLVSG